ncbi:ArsR/SmtB family transcription factor [Salinarimonas chemoclinalis]|uniref:ArsR/SmtB family transcription factor n=1 Tax=Salinarimonas chemoclinalis TaxID=3241599 RepID=UPI003555E54D
MTAVPKMLDDTAPAAIDVDRLLANARQASEFLKALSHETRLIILCVLIEGEKSVTELEEMLNMRQPAVSQQLARLRADDLVASRRDGKNIYYSLARPEVIEVIGALQRAFCPPEP